MKECLTVVPNRRSYLTFHSFDFGRTWWWLFQKRGVCTKLEIYVFITITGSIPLLVYY